MKTSNYPLFAQNQQENTEIGQKIQKGMEKPRLSLKLDKNTFKCRNERRNVEKTEESKE